MDTTARLKIKGGHNLIQAGIALFLVGLLTGFAVPFMANARMGLSSHLEGVMNGMFLVGLGLLWPRLVLGRGALHACFWLALYGTWANWATTLLAAWWGAGRAMPIAAAGYEGSPVQEMAINFGLISLSGAMIAVCVIVLWGLRRNPAEAPL
jgi:hydroxylaminobenzene mutase